MAHWLQNRYLRRFIVGIGVGIVLGLFVALMREMSRWFSKVELHPLTYTLWTF